MLNFLNFQLKIWDTEDKLKEKKKSSDQKQ